MEEALTLMSLTLIILGGLLPVLLSAAGLELRSSALRRTLVRARPARGALVRWDSAAGCPAAVLAATFLIVRQCNSPLYRGPESGRRHGLTYPKCDGPRLRCLSGESVSV